MTVAGILLTGGSSRRMGRDKAGIEVDGETLAARTAKLLRTVCDPVIEVGPGRSGLPVVLERDPGSGPLAAVADGWRSLTGAGHTGPALVVATDLPLLTEAVLAWLAGHPSSGSVVPSSEGRPQLLCARWSAPDLDRSLELVASGHRALRDLLAGSAAVLADEQEWGGAGALTDVDTPEDLERLGIGS